MVEMERSVTFLEDDEVVKEMDDLANKRGTDRSALIREAIRLLLEKYSNKKIAGVI